jgi:hypothetical protein
VSLLPIFCENFGQLPHFLWCFLPCVCVPQLLNEPKKTKAMIANSPIFLFFMMRLSLFVHQTQLVLFYCVDDTVVVVLHKKTSIAFMAFCRRWF